MAKKVIKAEPAKKAASSFTTRLDETRTGMLHDLMKAKGVSQNGIISIAISEMHKKEFPTS